MRCALGLAMILFWFGAAGCSKDEAAPVVDAAHETKVADSHVADLAVDAGDAADLGSTKEATLDASRDQWSSTGWKATAITGTTRLYGVWGKSATEVYAVGETGTILKFDGTSWKSQSSGSTADFRAVFGPASGGYVYAVGGEIYRLEGSSWVSNNTSTYYCTDLNGIWGTSESNLFAVGSSGDVCYRYSPTSGYWSNMYLSITEDLKGIWGASATEIYVVGSAGVIVKGNGTTSSSGWSKMSSPTSSDLQTVWGTSSTDVWAAGFDGVLVHYDGTSWSKVSTGSSSYFYGVHGSGSTNVFLVGHGIFKSDENMFRSGDGVTFTKVTSLPVTTYLNAVFIFSRDSLFAVGNTHILQYQHTGGGG
jgi:hypothetical protein